MSIAHTSARGAAGDPILLAEDLHCRIGDAHILDSVSVSLARGETLGIVGESGSGKSMLARTLMGIQTRKAQISGSIRVDGTEMVGADTAALRSVWALKLSMVFQDSATTFNPVVRIGRQLTEAMRLRSGLSRAEAEAKALRLLEQVRIPEPARRLGQYPHELSGGMRQRVAIAMAIACDPEVIIADEATTALDVTVQQQILDLLQTIQRERNMGMILISHDLGVIAGRADRIAVMYGGKVVETAPARTIFTEARHRYTRALLESIPTLHRERHSRLATIPGTPPRLNALPAGCRFAPRCRFADDTCRQTQPELVTAEPGHLHRCFHPATSEDHA